MSISLFGPGEQKTSYTNVDKAIEAGYEVSTRQRDFVFEVVDVNGNPVKSPDGKAVHLLILNPKVFSYKKPSASQVINTRGGAYTETKGVANRTLTISGTMGVNPLKFMPVDQSSLLGSFVAPVTVGFNDMLDSISTLLGSTPYQGLEELQRFEKNIIDTYYNERARWSAGERDAVFLNLYVIQDRRKYTLEPQTIDINRSSGTPLSYPYNFVFSVISDDESDKPAPDPRDFFDIIQDAKDAYYECEEFFGGGGTADQFFGVGGALNEAHDDLFEGLLSTYEQTRSFLNIKHDEWANASSEISSIVNKAFNQCFGWTSEDNIPNSGLMDAITPWGTLIPSDPEKVVSKNPAVEGAMWEIGRAHV